MPILPPFEREEEDEKGKKDENCRTGNHVWPGWEKCWSWEEENEAVGDGEQATEPVNHAKVLLRAIEETHVAAQDMDSLLRLKSSAVKRFTQLRKSDAIAC